MLWFAIYQEPISLDDLRESLVSTASKRELPGALSSLLRRCLIETAPRSLIEPVAPNLSEQNLTQFCLQPIVLKYVLERLIRQVCCEIEQRQVGLLKTHALFKAIAGNRAGKMQVRLLLQGVTEWLLTEANKPQEIERWLEALLEQQRQAFLQSGYIISNLQNLLMYCKQKDQVL